MYADLRARPMRPRRIDRRTEVRHIVREAPKASRRQHRLERAARRFTPGTVDPDHGQVRFRARGQAQQEFAGDGNDLHAGRSEQWTLRQHGRNDRGGNGVPRRPAGSDRDLDVHLAEETNQHEAARRHVRQPEHAEQYERRRRTYGQPLQAVRSRLRTPVLTTPRLNTTPTSILVNHPSSYITVPFSYTSGFRLKSCDI